MRFSWAICVLFGLNLLYQTLSVASELNSKESNLKSTLRPVIERVFSRKKRWMIFPKGSNLKFTVSVSKRLLALYPKGFTFNLEAAIYYPMPAARIDLIPKRLRKPTTKAPVHRGPTPLYQVGIPGSLIKYRAKPATKPAKVQRIDQNVSSLQWLPSQSFNWHPNNTQKWSKYSSPEYLKNYQWSPEKQHPNWHPNNSQKWSKYSSPQYLKNDQWSPEKQQKYVNKYSNYNNRKWSKLPTKSYSSDYQRWNHRYRYSREANDLEEPISLNDDLGVEYEPIFFEELESFEGSTHYYSYRGRRELFHHFEGLSKILGIDMKSCILRAVCDCKRFLLPPGYSMIQDILRVIFTFPTINGLTDDYSRIMNSDYQTCDTYTHKKCPFSILEWLLNSNKSM